MNKRPSKIETMIESLRPFTSLSLYDEQSSKSPRLVNLGLVYQKSYYLDGKEYVTYENNSIVFMVKELPLDYKLKDIMFKENMINAVLNKKCLPFLLFIDGKFIKWSNIEIIHDTYYNYIKIYNIKNSNKYCERETIIIPNNNIQYIENAIEIGGLESFIFNKNGLPCYDINDNDTTVINIRDKNLIYRTSIVNTTDRIKIDLNNYNFILNRSNIFIFDKNGFKPYEEVKILPKNIIKLQSNNSIMYKIFYNTNALYAKDTITNIINNEYVVNKILKEVDTDYIYNLAKQFNFDYDKSMSRKDWLLKTIRYILSYNADLISDHIYKMSKIFCIKYKGSELLNLHPNSNHVQMSRRFNECLETYIMVFKNGLLFEDHDKIEYKNKDFILPLNNINPDDIIDIYYFLDVDNDILKLPTDDLFIIPNVAIGPKNIDNMILFTDHPDNMEYDIGYSPNIQYQINYTYTQISDGLYNIIPDNSTYSSNFKFVSKKQFRYMSYIAKGDTIKVPLTNDFIYCNDISKYIVFINGRKIASDDFRITIPKNTRPFNKLVLYSNVVILKGSKIDIFYTSDKLQEIEYKKEVKNQSIIVDMSKLSYSLNPKLYMFFLNGRKLDKEDLVFIDYNTIKINPKEQINTTSNLSILQYIDSKDILKDLFDNNDHLTNIISKLTNTEIDNIFNIDGSLNDIEPEYETLSLRSIMYEIVKDFWCKPYINQGTPFIYDYDITNFYNYDEYDNIAIHVLNAMAKNKINIIDD